MNKKRLTLPFLLLSFTLASCGKIVSNDSKAKDSSVEEASSERDSSVEEASAESDSSQGESKSETPIEDGWSEQERSLFYDYLHGEVLAHPGFEGLSIEYDDYYEEIVMTAPAIETGDLAGYASYYSEEDGWVGGDISAGFELAAGTVFRFEKAVETEDGVRYVSVVFYGAEANGEGVLTYSTQGSFYLEASDPYFYEWPAEFAEYAAEEAAWYWEGEGDPAVAPVFAADHYETNGNFLAIYAYLTDPSDSDDQGYGAILEDAGWTVLEERDEYGYYVAVAPNESYQLSYLYDEDYGSLDIYFEEYKAPLIAYDSWQEDKVAGFFANWEIVAVPFEVPSIDIEGGEYYFYEDDENNFYAYIFDEYDEIVGYVDVYHAAASDLDAYLEKVVLDGWKVEADASTGAYTLTKGFEAIIATLEVYFDAENALLRLLVHIVGEPKPYSVWPEGKIAEELDRLTDGKEGVAPLPAYTGDNEGFFVHGNLITVLLGKDTSLDDAIASYAQDLLTGEFRYDEEDNRYVDPSETYFVTLYSEEEGTLAIYLGLLPEPVTVYYAWPAEEIAAKFHGELQDVIPALLGADEYYIDIVESDEDIFGSINCKFQTNQAEVDEIVADYNANLVAMGYTVYGNPEEGDTVRYQSPNEEYVIYVEIDDAYEGYAYVGVNIDNLVDGVL